MSKVIFHVDMNAFFASVEEIKHPFLINKPFVIASRGNERSIISTCSYEARKYKIHSAMNLHDALKLCPSLIVVDGEYKDYVIYSKKIMKIFLEYSDIVLQASIDEAYLDVTDSTNDYILLAKEIQTRILKELKLPCSIGIGPTLFLAKMASDMKKPLGITIIRKKDIKKKLHPLPIGDFYGIGKKSQNEFKAVGINQIGDLELKKDLVLEKFKGKHIEYIYKCLYGNSSDIVDPKKYDEISSVSNSRTYLTQVLDIDDAHQKIVEVVDLLFPRISRYKIKPCTITVHIRYEGFITKSKSKTFNEPIISYITLLKKSTQIFDDLWDQKTGIRLIGIAVSNFYDEDYNLFNYNSKENKFKNLIDEINQKSHKDTLIFAKDKKS